MTEQDKNNAWKTFSEEIEVVGSQLISAITGLIAEGNVRTIKVRSENGDIQFEIPMTAGVLTGGIVALAAPWLVVLGALAGMVAKLKIEVVRQVKPEDAKAGETEAPKAAPEQGSQE